MKLYEKSVSLAVVQHHSDIKIKKNLLYSKITICNQVFTGSLVLWFFSFVVDLKCLTNVYTNVSSSVQISLYFCFKSVCV